jgi:hypothetical protein
LINGTRVGNSKKTGVHHQGLQYAKCGALTTDLFEHEKLNFHGAVLCKQTFNGTELTLRGRNHIVGSRTTQAP